MSEPVLGRIHSIETFGAVDGPGIRYIVFLQGCPLKCLFCHNPDSWDMKGGIETNSKSVVENIKPYMSFIKSGGVTLSGGEPLAQPKFALDIINRCKALGLHTALDTAGSIPLNISAPVIDAADMLLLDVKAIDDDMSKIVTGYSNNLPLQTLEYTRKTKKPVWIRHVLLPGYSMTRLQLERLADHLMLFDNIEKVELLPFHKMGEFKWRELGMKYELFETPEPTVEEIHEATDIFKSRGLPING